MSQTLTVLAIPGSLREGSYNRGLLRAARELAPTTVDIELYDSLAEIPPYNEDVERRGTPSVVRELKDRIDRAGALLIATPEYNYSIPGVLKNAIDWASRPADRTPLRNKPTGILGASVGNFGTARAQLALRQVFVFTGTPAMLKPELLVFNAADRFSADGELTDESTRGLLRDYLREFEHWARENAPQPALAGAR